MKKKKVSQTLPALPKPSPEQTAALHRALLETGISLLVTGAVFVLSDIITEVQKKAKAKAKTPEELYD